MGLLDGILGGIVGAGASSLIAGFIEQRGGVGAIVAEFQEKGLGETVKSWVSTGVNLPVSAEQIQSVIGQDRLAGLASKLGMTPEELSAKVAEYLPGAIDKLTPNGEIPTQAA